MDDDLRTLERRWRATGAPADGAAWLAAAGRAGDPTAAFVEAVARGAVEPSQVDAAAWLGLPAAELLSVTSAGPALPTRAAPADLGAWVEGLAAWGRACVASAFRAALEVLPSGAPDRPPRPPTGRPSAAETRDLARIAARAVGPDVVRAAIVEALAPRVLQSSAGWVHFVADGAEATFIDARPLVVFVAGSDVPVPVRRALVVADLHLVERQDDAGTWWMGRRDADDGPVRCWGSSGPLEQAIDSL